MAKKVLTIDGNEAAAHVSYAFTEIATIYPITPSSPMAEKVDEWSAVGRKNIFGQPVRLVEMQSEAGAAGAMHGTLEAGALATTYTASQGLLLMIPPMYRMAGQLHPAVMHVSSRTLGTHAFSIFGDHSDVMSCRQTGFAMLASSSVQEIADLAAVAHMSAIKARVPFLHFFDGFRTSHEIQKAEFLEYEDYAKLVDMDAVNAFRRRALNPEHPVMKSTVQNPDMFFQAREAINPYYNQVTPIVEEYMEKMNSITGRKLGLFNYYGDPQAENIIIAMGSVSGTIEETVDYLRGKGEKVGFIQVHLYRPFSVKHLLDLIPASAKNISVLDRTKEPGAIGEPLYVDVTSAVYSAGRQIRITGGRYGLSSKDTTPAQIAGVFANMRSAEPKNGFTIGIEDDVTHLSLKDEPVYIETKNISCKFWGLGSDGTVGANKNTIKIIGDYTDQNVQAYFEYDTKKSYGITKSNLRFGNEKIRSSYLVKSADFVACHNASFIDKYDMLTDLKPGGTFLLNCGWNADELEANLPSSVKKGLADKNVNFFTIDATAIAEELGLGNRTNTVLQASFFKLANIIPVDDAVKYMKEGIKKTYFKKGEAVIKLNYDAVDKGIDGAVRVNVPEAWKSAPADPVHPVNPEWPSFVKNILIPANAQRGDELPVSAFNDIVDGAVKLGTSQYEKRGIAVSIPVWQPEKCIQCNQCAYVCPHAVIRPFLLTDEEASNAPEGFKLAETKGKMPEGLKYSIQVSTMDCTGCGICENTCPAKEKALVMTPFTPSAEYDACWEYAFKLPEKENPVRKTTVKGSQFEQPLLEFSGACAGCGETPYIKVVTQLYGDKMYFANATGCTQAWGAAMPSIPYTVNKKGKGPAWSNSLFENNAEFSLGMALAVTQQRNRLKDLASGLLESTPDSELKESITKWLDTFSSDAESEAASVELISKLKAYSPSAEEKDAVSVILENDDQLAKKMMWMIGGDGWAYDIGYGGLDHVLALGEDINILILDTEVYSNTGGQSSKATPIGAVAQFAASGKKVGKKDLAAQAIAYGNVYVAQVAMGANQGHLIKVLEEAVNYPGPSLVIAYAPCIAHGLKRGMKDAQEEMKLAVDTGYWHLFRYNPALKDEGQNPFQLDSKEPSVELGEFLKRETRYSALEITFPDEAERLFAEAERQVKEKFRKYKMMSESY